MEVGLLFTANKTTCKSIKYINETTKIIEGNTIYKSMDNSVLFENIT